MRRARGDAFLEAHTGSALLHRTTRTIKLSKAGERYVAACRSSTNAPFHALA